MLPLSNRYCPSESESSVFQTARKTIFQGIMTATTATRFNHMCPKAGPRIGAESSAQNESQKDFLYDMAHKWIFDC